MKTLFKSMAIVSAIITMLRICITLIMVLISFMGMIGGYSFMGTMHHSDTMIGAVIVGVGTWMMVLALAHHNISE